MKNLIHILIVVGAAMGCMDVNLLDDMVSRDADTGISDRSLDTGLDTGTVVLGPPELDTLDLQPPVLVTGCSENEVELTAGCGIDGNASFYLRFSTDEPAMVCGMADTAEVLSDEWATTHEVVIRKIDVVQQIAISVADVNGNERVVTLDVTAGVNPAIVIIEVLADCFGPEPDGEYVKIANVGNMTVDISGWMIDDNADRNGDVIPEGTLLPAGEMASIAMMGFSGANGLLIPLTSSIGTGGLKNSESESIQLFDVNGVLMDEYLNIVQLPKEGVPFVRRHALLPRFARNLWGYDE
ncbi:MAG: lamin tail domain-containing protein [Deltaproteobacteria bacterium]|nr:lamin tail domain-containing protein [Deltaproteobacteria bacterium]